MPGVPDIYQGSELWDSRWSTRTTAGRSTSRSRDGCWPAGRGLAAGRDDPDGAAKLLVVSRALRLRRDRPGLFTGYAPLAATGRPPTTWSRSTAAGR